MRVDGAWARLRLIGPVVGVCLVVIGAVFGLWSRRVDPHRIYRIGYAHNPPFQVDGPDGQPTGFAVEMVQHAAARAHIQLQWIRDRSSTADLLRRGEVDLWPVMADIAERRSWAYVSDVWMMSDNYLISRETTPPPGDGFRGTIPFSGPALMNTFIHRRWPGASTRVYASVDEMIPAFCHGDWPFVFVTSHQASAFLREVGTRCRQLEFRTQYLPELSVRLGVGARPQMAHVADRLREEIVAMGEDGELGSILAKYSYVGLTEARTILQLAATERQRRALAWALSGLAAALAILALVAWRLRRARRAADAANVAKSDFLANMSHEIRTPLGGVLGMIEVALDAPMPTSQREHLETAHSSARSLLALLNDVLDLSRIEARRLELAPIDFQPRALVDEIAALMGPVAETKGLAFVCEIDAGVPALIRADPVRVRQVLLNLIGNAIKFTPAGSVTVRLAMEDGVSRLRIDVRDTGIGIAAIQHTAVFEPFSQADGSIVRRFGGTGLGLAITKQLIEMMGGTIGYDSELGVGTTFTCTLAVDAADPAAVVPPRPRISDPVAARPLRVLVAEDNPVNQRLIRALLEKDRHVVTVVESGQGAVDTMHGAGDCDLVLMDIQMPGMDGFQATEAIRAIEGRDGLPIVALTAHAQVGYEEVCIRAGMNGYLSKPVDRHALRRLLAQVADREPISAVSAA